MRLDSLKPWATAQSEHLADTDAPEEVNEALENLWQR
jgi:hypothetical protein